MVEISYSTGSDCYFRLTGLPDPRNEFSLFLDLFKRNGITVNRTKSDIRSAVMEDGDDEYECVCGGIRFTLVHDMYWDMVNFAVKNPAQRSTLAEKLKAMVLNAASGQR